MNGCQFALGAAGYAAKRLDDRVIEGAQLLRDKAADKSGYYGPPQR